MRKRVSFPAHSPFSHPVGVGKDHGMFVPKDPETKKNAYWLAKNRTLRYYGLTNNVLNQSCCPL